MTDHVPVNHVSEKITPELISEKIDLMEASLLRDFGIRQPKIAVLGLNPHTGDHGVIGEEDDQVLRPTLEKIASTGKMVFGPFSADSFFGSGQYTNYDAVLASYHDQGLIPFKTLSFGEGVNFTAGLSKVRTSPDHGTAYEIAGKGLANISSFRNAVFAACSILRDRQTHDEITSNPLKIKPKKPENKKHRFV